MLDKSTMIKVWQYGKDVSGDVNGGKINGLERERWLDGLKNDKGC